MRPGSNPLFSSNGFVTAICSALWRPRAHGHCRMNFDSGEFMHNRLRTSNNSWDLRSGNEQTRGTQASSMEEACVPVVFRQKSCAYRDFWRFSIETLPLDRRSNARPGIRGSQAGYRADKLGRHLGCPPNSIQRIGSGSQDYFRARMAVSMRIMVTVILITILSLMYPSR